MFSLHSPVTQDLYLETIGVRNSLILVSEMYI